MHDDTFLTALTGRFDAHEEQLRAVALRITGSPVEAEEALAAARAGLGRDGGATVRAWLTAAVGQACVRRLQGRGDDAGGPGGASGPVAPGRDEIEPLWLALLVMLERLGGEERLAYVLHDAFGLPAPETARITGGSPEAAARLARRAREWIRGGGAVRTEGARERQRAVVDRFLAAARARDARVLVAVLDPDVVAYSEGGPVHGIAAVAETAAAFTRGADVSRPALVDGAVGAVGFAAGRPVSAFAATLRRDRIVTLSLTTGEEEVRALDLAFPDS
ncbi:sigma factor-like helix-turn-helix DNA-binding protein [Streptomyces tanashiensis]|uniref:RNA polymerase subunit sigma-70 n=1 Tax=Streptomyces tanashiensis TaxID=67367 RepID=A0ABY6R5W2_9ACTN|nr:sigma factor-like helix-turn-helix DNA-binding protein [Streptomyces tanashiensis]UZX24982.1 RNA polymerase subunit sigma-70 [Streptomyces tanashiensis]GGY23880.1 DNA-directed RNA polymerase sigma-70 factor [Streptomyces tanashiensis]